MKYVALLSGGKDSCFNLVCCSQNGHELTAAASLGPGQGKEEIDSFLYQTVGQDAIELVAGALDVPLYRKVISGSAVEQGGEYGSREGGQSSGGVKGDETEDLYELLLEIKNRHPEIHGVSVGAILSNYQRVRVEHVCQRLSLTPLCFLWQRDQEELLSEMIEARVEAVLIKVAGIGLKPVHLGKTLEEMQPTLLHLNNLYGLHVCGEGGEYETLTLDCPLFKKRIVLREVEAVIHSDSGFATVAYIRVKKASLEPKTFDERTVLPTSPILSEEFQSLESFIHSSIPSIPELGVDSINKTQDNNHFQPSISLCNNKKWVVISNLCAGTISPKSIGDEVICCFKVLQEKLHENQLSLANLAFVNLFISDMSQFPDVNVAYKTFFGRSPPLGLASPLIYPLTERRGLHVQGLSYWAPANIGPYSQSIILDERIWISGQIGMIPSTLQLPTPPNFAREAALSFQHAHRIMKALTEMYGTNWKTLVQGLVCWLVNESDIPAIQNFDKALDLYAPVPTIFVGAKSLPKGARVETQILAHTGQYYSLKDDEMELSLVGPAIFEKGGLPDNLIHWELSTFSEVSSFFMLITLKGDFCSIQQHLIKEKISNTVVWSQAYSVRLFHKIQLQEQVYNYVKDFFVAINPGITPVPVRFIATKEASDWDIAICIIGSSN
ncbi:meiotically up-regulated 71 [Pyrrhoderma noxium]|uniref:Diphthine--ammonia ligase n=1 Tax=Pyrrhoderma noxium TaxID=2282107 RepID=A0A286UNA6_9AGAM|nr:meiotically up-regulated 71 [Pyrrhoderma noxium]